MLKLLSALFGLLSLVSCASQPVKKIPVYSGLSWKVVYQEASDRYVMEMDNSKSPCNTLLCPYTTNFSIYQPSADLAVPWIHARSRPLASRWNTQRLYIGKLSSGKTIKMVSRCTYYICYEHPASDAGKQYVYTELMAGRDVEIDISKGGLLSRKVYLPGLGFSRNLEKLQKMQLQKTPLEQAL